MNPESKMPPQELKFKIQFCEECKEDTMHYQGRCTVQYPPPKELDHLTTWTRRQPPRRAPFSGQPPGVA